MGNRAGRRYDLESRTLEFAKELRRFVQSLPRTVGNVEDAKQVIRASGSIGANYIEANEALGKKDSLMRIRISRKEAKETAYWLQLLDVRDNDTMEHQRQTLITEAGELLAIFGAILRKCEKPLPAP